MDLWEAWMDDPHSDVLRHADTARLKPGRWMNDATLNLFLAQHDRTESSFFLHELLGFQDMEAPKKRRLERRLHRMAGRDLCVFPVHLDNHWTLCVLAFGLQTVTVMNSLVTPESDAELDRLMTVVCATLLSVLGSGWSVARMDVPQQPNDTDCGAYVAHFARCVLQGVDVTAPPEDMRLIIARHIV